MHKCRLSLAAALAAAAAIGFGSIARSEGAADSAPRVRTIVAAIVSADPKKAYPRVEAMAAYLAGELKDFGITGYSVTIAADNAEMAALLRTGAVDIVSETAFAALRYVEQGGARILAREWKSGVAEYRTLFITRRDSPINGLQDLDGRRLAVEDKGSTTGFLLPMTMLLDAGLVPAEAPLTENPKAGIVSYGFAVEELNIAALVARGIADAGVINTVDWEDIDDTPGPLKDQLRVFAESAPLVRSLILARGDLSAPLRERLTGVLLAMHESEAGREVLKKYYKVARYDEPPPEVVQSLEAIRMKLPLLQAFMN